MIGNVELAKALRKASRIREESWNGERYTISQDDAITQVVGDDPIAKVMDCLFTAGYSEMWDFCNQVLGKGSIEEDKAMLDRYEVRSVFTA